jgi:pimeloyl-ACP methyl ester carboxylesterase
MAVVGKRIDQPTGALRGELVLANIRLSILRWDPAPAPDGQRRPGEGRSLLYLHGLQSAAVTGWRLAEALIADGWHFDALDLPGHGESRWLGADGHPLADQEAVDPGLYRLESIVGIVREAVQQLQLPVAPTLVGHSWGAATALAVASTGMPLERLVLIDPPFLSPVQALQLGEELVGQLQPELEAALTEVRARPDFQDERDIQAKAIALTQDSAHGIRSICQSVRSWSVLDEDETWRQAREQSPLEVIVGDPAAGSMVWPAVVERMRRVLGPEHVTILAGASHSPQRTDFAALLGALQRTFHVA